MGRLKNEIEFCGIDYMVECAKKEYSHIARLLEEEKEECDSINRENPNARKNATYLSRISRQIIRTLQNHRLAAQCTDNERKKYEVSKPIAEFVVKEIMKEYFSKFEKSAKELLEEQARQMDEQINDEQEMLFQLGAGQNSMEYAGEDTDFETLLESYPELARNFDDRGILKKNCEYHIPVREAGCLDYVEQIIDRTMLRALFNEFFDFKEKEFRMDAIERSLLIDSGDPRPVLAQDPYVDGYSGLTKKLENPMGIYIFPKKTDKSQ